MRHYLPIAAVLAFLAPMPLLAAQTAESKACSDQASAKGLHGADRETFRATCMKGATPVAAAKPAAKPAAMPAVVAAKPAMMPAAMPAAAPSRVSAGAAPKSAESKACSDQATAKGLHGADRETFRSQCMKRAAPAVAAAMPMKPAAIAPAATATAATASAKVAPAKVVPAAMPAAVAKPAPATRVATTTTTTTGQKPRTPGQLASENRMRACGEQWRAAKAANKVPAGQTWPQYWSACNTRLKAA